MNTSLEDSLSAFAALGHCIALLFVAIACRRIRHAGGDRAFGVAAFLSFAALATYAMAYLSEWLLVLGAWWKAGSVTSLVASAYRWISITYQIMSVLLLAFTAAFAVACFRSARRTPRAAG